MYYSPMCCHTYFSIICYQMTVMKAVTLSMTIEALKFLLAQKMGSMVIICSCRVKWRNSFQWQSCCRRRTSKFCKKINIYDEINNVIQYCKEQDFNILTEILKYLKENLVQGRPLEIADASQCIDGETNFIMVDRSNLLNTAIEEIQHLQNKYLTLEVQFHNKVWIILMRAYLNYKT